jgi:hypothetical protein
MTSAKDAPDAKRKTKRGTIVYRDRSEWIGVKVPAIVCQEVFEKAQERMRHGRERYRQPVARQLLSGLIECGECGGGFSSYRRYVTKQLVIGKRRIYHKAAYKCNGRTTQYMHARTIERCRNPEIATHLLETKVFEMIRDIMLDPRKLRECMDFFSDADRPDHRTVTGQLTRVQNRATAVETEKKHLIDLYAADELSEEAYVNRNVALDRELHLLKAKKATLLCLLHDADAVGASIRDFCETARAWLEKSHDADAKRQFLADYIKRVVYHRYKVTVRGTVPIRPSSDGEQSNEASTLEFRIEGEINTRMLHRRLRQKFPDDGRLRAWGSGGRLKELVPAPGVNGSTLLAL